MNPVTSFIKRHPQITFWGNRLVDFVLWLVYGFPISFGSVAAAHLRIAAWRTVGHRRRGWACRVKTFLSRIVRVNVGIQWYLVALLLPLVLRLAAFGLNLLAGASLSPNIQFPAWGDLATEFVFIFIFIALGEEPGFRGYALPKLMEGRSALTASLILGVLHTIWHLPGFIIGGEPIINVLIIISGAVLITWIFNNTRGSVFIIMFLHSSVNLWVGVSGSFFSGADAENLGTWLAVSYVLMAVLLVVFTGRELGRKPEAAVGPLAVEQPAGVKYVS